LKEQIASFSYYCQIIECTIEMRNLTNET